MPKTRALSVCVRDFMAANLITLTPEMDILEATRLLLENRISGAPVIDKLGNIVGMLSEKDCLQIALSSGYHDERAGQVKEFMTTEVETVAINANVVDVAKRFLATAYRRYPVVDDENRLVGQISRRDVLHALTVIR